MSGGFCIKQTVALGDIDEYGHVNNVCFYQYAQNARRAFMAAADLAGCFTMLVANGCDYKKQVYYPDTLTIFVRIEQIGTTSLKHRFCYVNEAGCEVASAWSVVVVLSCATKQKVALTPTQKQKLLALNPPPHTR